MDRWIHRWSIAWQTVVQHFVEKGSTTERTKRIAVSLLGREAGTSGWEN
jgi:hypothetical protein